MSSLPKEQQTAYQRWELSSLGEGAGRASAAARQPKKEDDAAAASRLGEVLENMRREGYEKGAQEGYAVGLAQAREQAAQDRMQFLALMNAFSEALKQTDDQVAESMLTLSLDVAKAMLKVKFDVDPKAIVPVVKDAIHYLPYVQRPARILVNPADVQVLKQYLADDIAESQWQVHEDSRIERGGCIVETAANHIDATNDVRWKRIADALSQKNDWML